MPIIRVLFACIAATHAYELGTPFKLNSGTYQPSVDGNPEGLVVVSNGVQFCDVDGKPKGKSMSGPGISGNSAVAFPDRALVVQYNESMIPDFRLCGQFYTSAGVEDGSQFTISHLDAEGLYYTPSVAGNTDAFMVSWARQVSTTANVSLMIYTSDGAPVGDQIDMQAYPAGQGGSSVKVAGFANSFLVCYSFQDYMSGQYVSSAGELLGGRFSIIDGSGTQIDVAAGPMAYLVVWRSYNGSEVWGQYLGFYGARIGDNFRITTKGDWPSVTSTVTGFQVVWYWSGYAYSQSFGEAGGLLGGTFMVSTPSLNFSSDTAYHPVVGSTNSSILFLFGDITNGIYGRVATGLPAL